MKNNICRPQYQHNIIMCILCDNVTALKCAICEHTECKCKVNAKYKMRCTANCVFNLDLKGAQRKSSCNN